ncbi:unnamed protein product [Protopolystoma xenopodis]|uniref:Uncharacterized protein n=1 Tax=Protopolystoma xenopodis TaxID=117903 RepID=A0A448WA46_9PLAT|nr:unnamed protein product [Protopolystoma xenopodis]
MDETGTVVAWITQNITISERLIFSEREATYQERVGRKHYRNRCTSKLSLNIGNNIAPSDSDGQPFFHHFLLSCLAHSSFELMDHRHNHFAASFALVLSLFFSFAYLSYCVFLLPRLPNLPILISLVVRRFFAASCWHVWGKLAMVGLNDNLFQSFRIPVYPAVALCLIWSFE